MSKMSMRFLKLPTVGVGSGIGTPPGPTANKLALRPVSGGNSGPPLTALQDSAGDIDFTVPR
jgi:hypothetical protein